MQLDELTPEIIDQLEAGVEMDCLVTQATGQQIRWINKRRGEIEKKPSTDMDDAMLAAEKVGLFTYSFYEEETTALTAYKNEWVIVSYGTFAGEGSQTSVTYAPTPALAICRAILKLHLEKKVE